MAGGLGNQLFQFFFGTYIADKLEEDLQFRIDERNKFNLPNIDPFMNADVGNYSTEPNNSWKIYQRVKTYSKIKITPLLRFTNYYSSDVIGFDPKLELMRGNIFYSGYFQTYRFLESPIQKRLVSKLQYYSGSNEYSRIRNTIVGEKPIIVHIRRGDYQDHSKTIGLLSSEYYYHAIHHAREMVGDRKIYFMSDDNAFSVNLLKSIGVSRAEPIGIQDGGGAHETMFLGQLASVNILANSTFAWWSGYLNNDSIKIAPKKWFRSLNDPELLLPNHWHKIESSWDD